MAGGKIDILVNPDVKQFPQKLESGLKGGIGIATKIGGAISLALGSAATLKGIASLGVEFDSQMNTMAAVSQATAPQLAAVEERARELGKSADLTATSASDAAAAMVELAKGGFSIQESMDAAKGTLQLASAAQIDAAEAATIQSQALQAFGLDASYAATASDILAGAANASSAEILDVAQGMQQSGAVANMFGLTLEDNATALAMFANAGIQGSDAGTLLKSALLALANQSVPAAHAFEELGLDVYDAAGEFRGLESLFGQLETASKSMTAEQYHTATAMLFGSDAMRLAGVAAAQGADGWNKNYDAVTRAGQASEVAAAQAAGIPGLMESIENTSEDMGLAIYKAFSELALDGGTRFVGMLESAAPRIEGAATSIATGIEKALPTVERVTSVVADGVGDIADGLTVIGGAGVSTITSLAGVLAPAGEGALNLAEGLDGLSGPLIAASAALAIGKWKNWDGSLRSGAGSVKSLRTRIMETARMQDRLSQSVMQGSSHVEGIAQDYVKAGVSARSLGAAIETQVPWISRAAQTYRTHGDGLRTWSTNSKRWASETVALTGEVHSLEANTHRGMAAVSGLAGTLGGGLAAGASVGKSALSGVVSFLGGPLNVAIAAATFAITGISAAIDRSRDSARLLKELEKQTEATGDALFAAFARGTVEDRVTVINDSLREVIDTNEVLADKAPGAWGRVTAVLKDAATSKKDVAFESWKLADAEEEVAKQAKLVTEAFEDIDLDKATAAVTGTDEAFELFLGTLDSTDEKGRIVAETLREQRDEFLKAEEAVASLAPGSIELSDAFKVLGDEASSAEDKTKALRTALDNILGIEPSSEDALFELHASVDRVTESAEKAIEAGDTMQATFNEDGRLDPANKANHGLRDSLNELLDSLLNVATTGGDVDAAYDAQRGTLALLAEQYGVSEDKVRHLYDTMGGQPELIETIVSVNTNEATAGLGTLWGHIRAGQVEAGKPFQIAVDSVDAVAAIEGMGGKVKVLHDDFENGLGVLEVIVDTDEGIADIDEFVSVVAAVDSEKGVTFSSNAGEVTALVDLLGVEISRTPDGDFRIDSNSPEQIEHMLELGFLVRDPMTGEVRVADNLQPVLDKAWELSSRDGNVVSETYRVVTQRITEWSEYYRSGRASDSAGVSVGQHYRDGGRHLPRYAAGDRHGGYRIRKTGPGTEKTDGFTAFDRFGNASARLDAGEWVVNGVSSETYDPLIHAINADTPRARTALSIFRGLPGLASGGQWRGASSIASSAADERRVAEARIREIAEAQRVVDQAARVAAYAKAEGDRRGEKNANALIKQLGAEYGVKAKAVTAPKNSSMIDRDWLFEDLQERQEKLAEAEEKRVAHLEAGQKAARTMSQFYEELAKHAESLVQLQHQMVGEQVALRTAGLSRQRAAIDMIVAEQDIARARVQGAISVADAEAALQRARESAALKGSTGIDAMSDALDRARRTGIFAVADVTDSMISGSAEVAAAQAAVDQARVQALADEAAARNNLETLQLDMAENVFKQQVAQSMIAISEKQEKGLESLLSGITASTGRAIARDWEKLSDTAKLSAVGGMSPTALASLDARTQQQIAELRYQADVVNAAAEAQRLALDRQVQLETARLDAARSEAELRARTEQGVFAAEAEIAGLLGRIATAETDGQAAALADAAVVAAERRDAMLAALEVGFKAAETASAGAKQTVRIVVPARGESVSREDFISVIDHLGRIQDVLDVRAETSAGEYLNARTY